MKSTEMEGFDRYKIIDSSYENGHYYQYGDRGYDDVTDLVIEGMLGFCGCGMPEQVLGFVHKALRFVANLKEKVWPESMTYDEWRAEVRREMPTHGIEYFVWYVLDRQKLLEHGGSVPGWLTPKGKELLADLDDYLGVFTVPCSKCASYIGDGDIDYMRGSNEEGEDYTQINATCPECGEEYEVGEWGHMDSEEECLHKLADYIGYAK